MARWKLNKEIPFSASYTAKFYTLYEDVRDVMCDSPRPEYAISHRDKNRMVEVVDDRRRVVFRQEVSKDEGNAMYLEMKPLDRHGYGTWACNDWLRAHGANI